MKKKIKAGIRFTAHFHYERGKEHFLFIDLQLKQVVKIEASAKKSIKQTKNALFHACSGNRLL